MSAHFEEAKRMMFTGEHLLAPRRYVDLLDALSRQQRTFLYRESEVLSAAPNRLKEG